jgi:hypothetical protein
MVGVDVTYENAPEITQNVSRLRTKMSRQLAVGTFAAVQEYAAMTRDLDKRGTNCGYCEHISQEFRLLLCHTPFLYFVGDALLVPKGIIVTSDPGNSCE